MINNHSAFIDFDNNKIKLTTAKLAELRKNRDALRKKIKEYMSTEKENEIQPKFHSQGSIPMGTAVNPLPATDSEGNILLPFDLDDGVYFISDDEDAVRKTVATYHNWILSAVSGHTKEAIDKTTCVRVMYADGHHIDLPIYYLIKDGIPQLAHKSKDWFDSDPREFAAWFNDLAAKNGQLRRMVRYLKAWKNYREVNNTNLWLPSGFALTILAAENFKPNDRDDVAFRDTVNAIHETLKGSFECCRPTVPKENIFKDYSDRGETQLMDTLARLISNCDKAADETNYKASSEYLRKEFGDRFPLGKDEDVEDKKKRVVAGLASTIAPRPYGLDNNG